MKRVKKSIILCLIISAVLVHPCMKSQAHDLYEWSYHYPTSEADQNNSFGIDDSCHIKGRTTYYRWDDNVAFNNFGAELLAAESSWGGMIDIEDNAPHSYWSIIMENNEHPLDSDTAMSVFYGGSGSDHFSVNGYNALLVISNDIINYSSENKRKIFAHELGHYWGLGDFTSIMKI